MSHKSSHVISKTTRQLDYQPTRATSASYDLCMQPTLHSKILANLQFITTNNIIT